MVMLTLLFKTLMMSSRNDNLQESAKFAYRNLFLRDNTSNNK